MDSAYRAAIEAAGFECTGECPASSLRCLEEVRAMCADGHCAMYGNNWACPPHTGTLESYQSLFDGKECCVVLQTVMQQEDEFDVETMMLAEQTHRERIQALAEALSGTDAVILSAGTCTLCPSCTCPDGPCVHPEKRLTSMEAAGLLVSDVCSAAGIPYNHGRNTIAFVGCLVA